MPYASEIKQLGKKPIENESFLTNTENETELPVEVPSTSFTERLDEEIEADLAELRAHLQAIISGALPGFYEFQQAGYNLLYPKKVDIDALQARVNTMQIPALIQPQHTLLEQAANAFLDRFRRFRKESDLHNNALEFIKFRLEVNKAGWDEPQNRDYHQALKHGNRLSGYLSGTLDLMSLLNENVERQTPWETTRQANYDVLLNELLPVNADAHNNQYAAQTRGNLTGKQPDNIKFNAIVDSVTLDERIARETVSAEIERLSARLLSGITLTRNYAEKPDETGETSGIKRDIDSLCQVLQSVIPVVQYAGKQIQPETYQPLRQKAARTTRETVTHELGKAWNAVGQKMQGAKATVQTLSDKANKNKHRIAHTVSDSTASDTNGDSHNINKAVFQVGIRLLDKIQQTTSDMHKAIQTSRPLQQAVSHYSELDERLSGMPHNSILDAKLRTESSRWRQKADESRKQLQHVLGTITTLSDESMRQRYLSALREELNAVTKPLAINTIIRDFDTQVKATVEGLSDVQKALGQALLRLSEHGQAGGKELDNQTVSWLQQLKGIKDNLKTGITQATGQSINNFSRQGMLARYMAEWREAEKQRYLATLSAEERAATENHYDNVFFEVIQHYLPQLSKESDPQGERLLQRLRLEVGNAAKGNTLYPATMADILAGMKSPVQAIRDWSERKLIRGAFLAVCLGGFKLLPNLAALPLRLPIKFAITGAKVAWGAHKGRQGIRGGEGDIRDEIAEYAKQSYKTAAIKIVLSLPPGLATTLGIASIAWRVYEGGLKGAGEKIAKHIIGEAPWRGLDTGSKALAEAYVTTLIEAAITEEEITSVSHSPPLQPQMDVKPLSDEHDPADQLEDNEKQASQRLIRRKRHISTGGGNGIEQNKEDESYFSSIGKDFRQSENKDTRTFGKRKKNELSKLILNIVSNKTSSSGEESNGDFFSGGDEKFSNLVIERYHYIKIIEPNITDADAKKLIFKSLESFIKINVDKLSYNNLYVSLQALHSVSDEDNDFDMAISKLNSKHYKFEGKFNISEENYVRLKEAMYQDERDGKQLTIKLPADEINSNGELTSEGIKGSIIKLTDKITDLTNKNIEDLMLVKYEDEGGLIKLSLIDMKSLIKYLKVISDEDTIAKMKDYKPKGNYEDVIFAADLAHELISRMQTSSEGFFEEELSAVIYKATIEKKFSSLNLTKIYNRFILDKERLNPFYESLQKEKPAGYFTISDFKKSGDAESRSAFNQQFYDYRDKYNKYDAGILSGSIIAGSGITLDEFNQKPKSIQTWAVFGKSLGGYTNTIGEAISPELNPAQYIPGRVILMQLSSGRYLLVSNLLGSIRSVILTEQAGDNINGLLSSRKLVGFEKGWFNDEADARYRQYDGLYYFNQVNEMIIKPLYGKDWNNNPIRNISHQYFTLAKDDKAKPILIDDKSTVAGTLAQGLEIAQAAYVENLHQAMDETDSTWKVIRGFIPFYNIIYNSSTDSEYKIDSGELLLDLASVVPVVKAAGAAGKSASEVMKLGRTALKAGMKNGLRGFDLFKYVAKQVSPDLLSAASKNSLLMTKAFYDAIEPVPIRSTLKGLYKGVKSDLKLTSLDDFSGVALTRENIKVDLELTNDGVLKDNSGQSFISGEKGDLYHVEKNHSNNRWILVNGDKKTPIINSGGRWWKVSKAKKTRGLFRKDWEVNDINFEGVHSNHGIYNIRPDNPQSMQDYNYYIKNNNKFYQVKYDEGNHTLRLINPTSSSRSGYFPPIKLNKNDKWVFNTNVGLKGGGKDSFLRKLFGKNKHQSLQTHEPSTASSVPNLPASTPQRQINYNLTSDIDAAAYLEELKQKPSVNNKIMNPAGQCESLMNPVSDFMKDKGFDNIRYRGMFIWNNATEQIPMNHFAVVGNKGGKDYVFDISAHQFESKGMRELNGPLILSAEEWVGKYSGATKRKLIYYTDFSNSRTAANTYNALPRELESESKSMVVKVFVTSPTWYNTFKKQKNIPSAVTVASPRGQASTSAPPAPAVPPQGQASTSVPPAPAMPPQGQASTSVPPAPAMSPQGLVSTSAPPAPLLGNAPPPPPAPLLGNMPLPMKIGKPPVTSGPSTAPGAVTPQTMTIGPVKPKPLSGIPEPKVKELEALALSARGGSKKPADMSSKEERYYGSLVNYYEKDVNWKNIVNKGQGKYSEFYEAPPRPVSKSEEYHLRYEEKTSPEASTAPYIDKDGNVATPAGKVTDIHVKGEPESYYKFRVSDDGKVFVVDNMYRNRDVQVTKPGRGNPLNMNELQGEFMKKNGGLLKNVEFITQENIANADTHNLMRLAFGENVLRASANKPIVLKPEGPTKDAFYAMLTTPNIQPTARMLSTYPEFGKQIKEIRIQSVTRITSTLESSDMPGQARSRIARDTNSSNQVEETFVLRITLVLTCPRD
jgi:hypothetical protein